MSILKRIKTSINSQGQTLGQLNKTSTTVPKIQQSNEEIQVTAEYQQIKDFIDSGEKLIFVTGGAGTGKSTFVKWIESQYQGKVAIAAPTGIAALTVSGVTIHRLCKFPPAWIVKEDINVDPKSVIPKIEVISNDPVI